jgi:hypothetical protein
MNKKLEIYLEEISHFLSGRQEREEILSEIRSHILEKAAQEPGPGGEVALEKVIAAYGQPRRVAEKYLEGQPVIAPAFLRHLFRYTSLLFAVHLAFTLLAVIFKESFIVFPFLFVPRLGPISAVFYLPMAFLADFGAMALVLYFVTRSGREIRLPWPRFALDLEEVKAGEARTAASRAMTLVGAGIMLALTGFALELFLKHQTIFFVSTNFKNFRPLLMPAPGRMASLAVLAMMAAGTTSLFIKLFSISRRVACKVDATTDVVALVAIGVLLRQQHTNLFAVRIPPSLYSPLHITLTVILTIVALIVAVNLVANVVRLSRHRLGR